MESLRKWFCRPKKDDKSLLAQFFYADEALNFIASELDSFDGRKDPERCTALVNQLRQSQDRVLTITNAIMDVLIGDERANRDFRVKFPEDVLQENLAGQLWFGAECLAAGSSIMNREAESAEMRPLAKALTKTLDNVRSLLREACLRNNTPNGPLQLNSDELITEMLVESLKIFDRLFAEFELCYVSAMVPVKTTQEYELQELIGVLFSETLQRALKMKLLTQDMVDDYDPALMFTIPRLAIVSGLLVFPNGPLCIDKPVEEMSEMFRPFRTLLHKIRELLWTLNKRELFMLEKLLCDNEQITDVKAVSELSDVNSDLDDFVNRFYNDYPICKDFVSNFCTVTVNNGGERDAAADYEATEALMVQKEASVSNEITPTSHSMSECIQIPSTSGYLIANTVTHDSIVASMSYPEEQHVRGESLPDSDCLEVVSAKLSSILLTKDNHCDNGNNIVHNKPSATETKNNKHYHLQPVKVTPSVEKLKYHSRQLENLDSPDDSGICTENTSLDRSPSLDFSETKHCSDGVVVQCQCSDKTNLEIKHNAKCTYSNKLQQQTNKTFSAVTKHSKSSKAPRLEKTNEEENGDDDVSISSSDTSSFNSNCADDEEIALAMQAAEIANRNEVRAKFRSSEDLVHRLFVCIAGVADQLQTNFASDLRNILKSVFLINATNTTDNALETSIEYHPSESEVIESNEFSVDPNILAQEALFDSNVYFHVDDNLENGEQSEYSNYSRTTSTDSINGAPGTGVDVSNAGVGISEALNNYVTMSDCTTDTTTNITATVPCTSNVELDSERPPIWIPDIEAPKCMSCSANFTVVKRRHHCRNCGKVFCARCSSNSVPLPKYGHIKAVRVCNKCFMYHLTPFTMS
ncbi:uncharacterized protein CBL_00918 [Carabus blaptoides fortunei]